MQLEDFLRNASYFSLGHLPTEGFHPLTSDLSLLAVQSPGAAVEKIRQVDLAAIGAMKDHLPLGRELADEVARVFDSGNRVFLSGCGATGRLALALESTFRAVHRGTDRENRVQGLMAGGDFALVKSVENFEDFPQYGVRHLEDLGFGEGDLLIAITEGGETPYVIGTVQGALSRSQRDPWFVYCNPRNTLVDTVARSREVIEHPRVRSLCLPVGPMALSGSTRLQAATVQMLVVGMALSGNFGLIDLLLEEYGRLRLSDFLSPFIEWESSVYARGGKVLYQTSSVPIAVLTDTTERSPTFSLTPFESSTWKEGPCSWCYLSIPDARTAQESWNRILNRDPIGLGWEGFEDKLGTASILEFDFGRSALEARARRIHPSSQDRIQIETDPRAGLLEFKIAKQSGSLRTPLLSDPWGEQLLVKLLLNTLSLVVMGRMGRYEGNVMTWVRASNGKLIDRTLRYLDRLIGQRGLPHPGRQELAERVFRAQSDAHPDEAVILRVLDSLKT
jgi:N-acetylmuramic acid 6-phosphate etherase